VVEAPEEAEEAHRVVEAAASLNEVEVEGEVCPTVDEGVVAAAPEAVQKS
jgi:hypothetical protein